MAVKVGFEGFAYRNTGTLISPTWSLMSQVKDITVPGAKTMADMGSRASGGWRWKKSALKELTVDLSILWDDTDTDTLAIRTAWAANGTVELMVLDNSRLITGACGWRAVYEVSEWARGETLEEGMMVTAKCELAYGSIPTWVTVA